MKGLIDFYRKINLRRTLLDHCVEGAIYLPFCGDGDIAVELYKDRQLYAADNDSARIQTFHKRFPEAQVKLADCNKEFPFGAQPLQWALADFDAYVYPYEAFRYFWAIANKADPLVLFFTDGQRQAVNRAGYLHFPDGHKEKFEKLVDKRLAYNFYMVRVILPWFAEAIKPWHILKISKYMQQTQLYWGAIISKQEGEKVWAEPQRQGGEHKKKFDAEKKAKYLKLIHEGIPRCLAAARCGVSPETVTRHMECNGSFGAAVSQAEMEADDEVEVALYELAKAGNVVAQQVWLYNRKPQRWKDQRAIKVDGIIKVEHMNAVITDMVNLFIQINAIIDSEERQRLFAEGADRIVLSRLQPRLLEKAAE